MVHIYNPALQVEVGGGDGELMASLICVSPVPEMAGEGGGGLSISMICWIKPFSHMTKSLLYFFCG